MELYDVHGSGKESSPARSAQVSLPTDAGRAPASIEAFQAACAGRLRVRFDEIAGSIFESIRREVPDYGSLGGDDEASIHEGVRGNTDLFLRLLGEGRELDDAEIEALEALGRERARQGIPLASFQQAVRVGVQVGLRFIAEDVRCHAESEGVADGGACVVEMLEATAARAVGFVHDVHVVVADGYREVERERLAVAVRGEMGFVDRLVEGTWVHDETIFAEAELAGVSVTSPCALLVLVVDEADRVALGSTIDALCERFDGAVAGPIHGGRRLRAAVLCPVDGHAARRPRGEVTAWRLLTGALDRLAREHGVVAFAERVERASRIAAAHGEIERHLDGIQGDLGAPGVVEGCELAFLDACARMEADRAAKIVRDTLGGFLGAPRLQPAKYLETLDALARRADKKDAARALGVRLSTLQDRVARIRELTGFDPNIPADAFRLRVAASLYRIHAGVLPEAADPSWRDR